jgi:riboflavin synthase
MFTGIIREVGIVRAAPGAGPGNIEVECPRTAPGLKLGDSVAVNGVCLTADKLEPQAFRASMLKATCETTNLSALRRGDKVNLEPALSAGEPFGGHFVQGHVDAAVRVISWKPAEGERDATLRVELPEALKPLVFAGASVALNGVSLTVREVQRDGFSVSIIQLTAKETNLSLLKAGLAVNLEVDMLVKSVYHCLLQMRPGMSLGDIAKLGYGK